MSEIKSNKRVILFLVLHLLLVFYSFCGVFSKIAAKEEFLSFRFILLYGLALCILGVYAVVWQQVLKHVPLTTAFCNKSVSIIWGILWGFLFFHEAVKWNMLLGAAIVIVGVVIVVMSDEH